jgi:carboxyl-terminal processing protease
MKPRFLIQIGIIASMVSGVGLGVIGYRAWFHEPEESDYAQVFDRILSEVHQNYVDEVPKERLVHNALRGMLRNLDNHSVYLDHSDWDNLQSETTGEYGGVGIELGVVDDQFTVVAPIAGTPADEAGLRAGDRILEMDREALAGTPLPEVVQRMRGEPGTLVHLRIQRDGAAEPWDVELVRSLVHVNSVTARLLEPGYGYVRIAQFQVQTGDEFAAALEDLNRQSGGKLQGLVLDLRNNPGGVLQASVAVADAMLREGLIVYTEGRQPSSQLKFRAARNDLLDGAPVAVLINEGSASAAEVVAGALQDHGRAVLIGTRSYGKGSVQSVVQVSDDEAIKLTTAYYYTPNGRNIHHAGIEPDIERAPSAEELAEGDDAALLSEAVSVLKRGDAEGLHARL